ncbi:MAG: T9SS type A sorting domain-containing protein [Saprospiraceae bacterium]|jgi:hypothetical protein|nr:T9SS type A sorting domain-containing protein [Saprospiraceae bacterium]
MHKKIYFAFLLLFLANTLSATHNLSGEIVFQKTGGLGVTATIVTYTKATSVNADRDSLLLCWGDGNCTMVARSNGTGEIVGANIKKNIYIGHYTYAAEGVYWISMTDQNRSSGIINVNPPASDNVPFHLEAMVRLLPDAAGSLHSPVFLEPPVDIASLYLPFVHVPNAFDADDDSLVYELAVPMQGVGELVPNYSWPNQIVPNPENQISLDPATGKFTWDAPQAPGHYCIAIVVRAYRNGTLVEETRRDLFIEVSELANTPPVLVLIPDISEDEIVEVTVGQIVQIQAIATDPDPGQTLTLTASGGLFEDFFQEKATFVPNSNTGMFSWTVKSEHVRTQPHQILFKAKDDFLGDGFAATRIVRFRASEVVGVVGANPDLSGLHIFPNPNAGTFMVELPEPASADLIFRIVGITGQVLRELVVQSGITTQTVQAGGLPSGLYFLQVVSNGKVLATERFVKQ